MGKHEKVNGTADESMDAIGVVLDDYYRGNLTSSVALHAITLIRAEYELTK